MRRVLLALAVVLTCVGCSPFGSGDAPAAADSVTAPPGGTPSAGSAAEPDAGLPLPVVVADPPASTDPAAQTADSVVVDSVAVAAPPDSVTALLRSVLAEQRALARRVDSLAARGRLGAGPSAEAGQVLGEAREQVQNFGLGVFWSILVLLLFNVSIRALVWLLDQLAERNPNRRLFYKRLVPVIRILLWIFAAYLIVRVIFQVDAQGLLAAAAAVGVAVGFAAQDLLKNLFGGIILVFDQPFQVGDKISVGGTYGEVVSIGLRSTRIVTPDDNLVSVPNAQVVDGQVANANAGELNCQVVTDLYLPGFVDEARAKKIAFEAAASSKYVYLNKPIVVLVKDEFNETFLTRVRVKAYVLDPRYEFLFQSDVTERARSGFRDAGLIDPVHGLRAWLDVSKVGVPGGRAPQEDGAAGGSDAPEDDGSARVAPEADPGTPRGAPDAGPRDSGTPRD